MIQKEKLRFQCESAVVNLSSEHATVDFDFVNTNENSHGSHQEITLW